MIFSAIFSTAIRALRANAGRSFLTILGIVIGILSVVLVITMGQAARQLILSEVEGIGATSVILRPGRQPQGPADVAETILADSITHRDIAALRRKENVPNAVSVNPSVLIPGTVTYRDNLFRGTVLGWTPRGLEEIFQIFPEEGAYFTEDDIRQRAKVAVIGWRVKDELFGDSSALGESIKVRGHNMRVIGVLPKRGQVSFFNVDELVLLPYSTGQRTILNIDYYHEVFVQADTEENVPLVVGDIEDTLRETHDITDPKKDDFYVQTQQEAVEIIGTITRVLTIFLSAIASIALVVGGIGIMNIMLVSVTERTREIGLRKALGATNRDILIQFLLEAVLLTVSGGIIGTTLAALLSTIAATIIRTQFSLNWPYTLPPMAILLGVGVAAIVGLVFGIFPARKAAAKDPIEALRYE